MRVFHCLITLLVAAVLTGCQPSSAPIDATGVDGVTVREVAQFQAAEGLFVLPETADRRVTSPAATAFILREGPDALRSLVLPGPVRTTLPNAPSLSDALAHLELMVAVDASWRPSAAEAAGLRSASPLPPDETDVGAQVGALASWARFASLADAVEVSVPASERLLAIARADAVSLDALRDHPYLLQRLREARASLGAGDDARLDASVAAAAASPFGAPAGLERLWDAVAQATWGGRPDETGLRAWDNHLRALVADPDAAFEDRVAATRLADLLGLPDAVAAGRTWFGARIDEGTRLVLAEGAAASIEATYLAARLLDTRFAEVASPATLDRLRAVVRDDDADPLRRVKAASSLKVAGDPAWRAAVPTIAAVAARWTSPVTRDTLAPYLEFMEAALQVDPDLAKAPLHGFAVSSAADERLAAAAIELSYVFANSADVAALFPGLVAGLPGWVSDQALPFQQRVTAMVTLAALPAGGPSGTELTAFGAEVDRHRGCSRATSLLPVDGRTTSPCSLILTLRAQQLPRASR